MPEFVILDENYKFTQEISRNPSSNRGAPAVGRIRIRLPYDGHKFFTREAVEDVEHGLRQARRTDSADVLVGHLVLTNHQNTDLSATLDLAGRYGAVPLRIPVRSPSLRTIDALRSDRYLYTQTVSYLPSSDTPKVVPLRVEVMLEDPDNADVELVDGRVEPDDPNSIAKKIMQFISFESSLSIRIRVRIFLPERSDKRRFEPPILRRVAVKLPTINSIAPSSLKLKVDKKECNFQHNPLTQTVEWVDIPTMVTSGMSDEPDREESRQFHSDWMNLTITHPGELFATRELFIEVDGEVQGELLSGTDARLFNSSGDQYRAPRKNPLVLRSTINHRCTVVLRDAFARRELSPYQQFHFDEIIPDELRIADVASALRDQRFQVVREARLDPLESGLESHYLAAVRQEGADQVILWVFVHGRRYETQRRSTGPGGRRYISKIDSGDLRLVVRGSVHRDSSALIHAVNELQSALRDRFRRLKAQR